MRCYPSRAEYEKLSAQCRVVPVYCELPADLETPVSLWSKVAQSGMGFLLESVEKGERFGRYSFLGVSPHMVIRTKGTQVVVEEQGKPPVIRRAHPLAVLRELLRDVWAAPVLDLPFTGGAVGYTGFEVAYLDGKEDLAAGDGLDVYDCVYMFPEIVYVFDHLYHTIKVIYNSRPKDNPEKEYQEAQLRLEKAVRQVMDSACTLPSLSVDRPFDVGQATSSTSPEAFMEAVREVQKAITQGDVEQVVLAQRLEVPLSVSSFAVYRALRSLNPSSYVFYLDLGDYQLLGSSPETLVRLQEGKAEIHPIAGTRPRGATPAEDEAYVRELMKDEKEVAEHQMLVELGLRELELVCVPGTVRLEESMEIIKYSHVMHMVSRITGRLAAGQDQFDLFRTVFPAGTVSGFPKKRALELVQRLEPHRRGPYAGAVGYFRYQGNMDQCITIRSTLCKDGRAYVYAGAGIVAQSVPEREYQETLHKARAVLVAINHAEQSLLAGRREAR